MKNNVLLIFNKLFEIINKKKRLKLVIKNWFLDKKSIFNSQLAFFIRYILEIKVIYDFAFEKMIKFDFENVKLFFRRQKRKYIRDFAYLHYYLNKFNQYQKQYIIPGTRNISGLDFYNDPNIYPKFQKDLQKFKNLLVKLVNQKANATFYKFGDGDYFFLKQIEHGSAKPGKRAISKKFNEINIKDFIEGVRKNDYFITEILPHRYAMFKELYPDKERDFPSEYCSGLVANKWFFNTFKGKIGLIGAKEKLELIEKLLKFKEYREYLGIDDFNDYIYIPQKFAADDVNTLEKNVAEQLKNSNSEIFLLGIGHVKSALLHRLKKYKKAVYVDVGGAIDAIAGIMNIRRLHMAKWVNYQIKNYDYSKIDYLNYHGWGKHIYL